MSELILHHYPTSPFSEKVRLILGAKGLAWRSVLIPAILPKPDLVALTGGYRKTPVMQIGADIYCDTALIARKLDELAPEPALYLAEHATSSLAVAQWVDSFVFQAAVALLFQRENLAELFPQQNYLDAFLKDRQQMGQSSKVRRLRASEAQAVVDDWLRDLEAQLTHTRSYLFGAAPTIADFSTYHVLWFLRRATSTGRLIEPHKFVVRWLERMKAFGHGNHTELSGADAVGIASQAQPAVHPRTSLLTEFNAGDAVEVMPADYGIDPVPGVLEFITRSEIAIRRTDPRAGDVVVHFPRVQYEILKAKS
jgi:glutathione S-transferase